MVLKIISPNLGRDSHDKLKECEYRLCNNGKKYLHSPKITKCVQHVQCEKQVLVSSLIPGCDKISG